jgi:hypothetical protein
MIVLFEYTAPNDCSHSHSRESDLLHGYRTLYNPYVSEIVRAMRKLWIIALWGSGYKVTENSWSNFKLCTQSLRAFETMCKHWYRCYNPAIKLASVPCLMWMDHVWSISTVMTWYSFIQGSTLQSRKFFVFLLSYSFLHSFLSPISMFV